MTVEVHFNLWSAHLPFYPSPALAARHGLVVGVPSSTQRESPELSRALSLGSGEPIPW